MKIALEWFLNPDHLPLIVAREKGFIKEAGIDDLEIIVPDAHYDGLSELLTGNIELATNEPLHLIEQYNENFLTLGTFFQTRGGVMMKKSSYSRLQQGEVITVATPVANEKTNRIGLEIIQRYARKNGFEVMPDQVVFDAKDFYLIDHIKKGADAAWLYFYNFEGIEAEHEGMPMVYMDAETAGFANFCGLDIFVTQQFYADNKERVNQFTEAIRRAIRYIQANPQEVSSIYYQFSMEEPSELMDDILLATINCFNPNFTSSYADELPILHFFREIGITDLEDEKFKTAFI